MSRTAFYAYPCESPSWTERRRREREQAKRQKRKKKVKAARRPVRSIRELWREPETWSGLLVYHFKRKPEGFNLSGAFLTHLWDAQDGRCAYCYCRLDGGSDSWCLEHMTPLSRGGLSTEENVCFACADCNLRKFVQTAEEFLASELRSGNGGAASEIVRTVGRIRADRVVLRGSPRMQAESPALK